MAIGMHWEGHIITSCSSGVLHAVLQAVQCVAMGGFHTVAVTGTGAMAWGCNDAGQLGTGDYHDRRQPAPAAGLEQQHVAAVACGASHTLFLCKCGLRTHSKPCSCIPGLVLRAARPGPLMASAAKHFLSRGPPLQIVLLTFCDKLFWQIARRGSQSNQGEPIDTSITASLLLLRRDGSVLGCGLNDSGQLPLGPTLQQSTVAQQHEQEGSLPQQQHQQPDQPQQQHTSGGTGSSDPANGQPGSMTVPTPQPLHLHFLPVANLTLGSFLRICALCT
jgi:Regulator of chromosome condensation (RCC1) repeat